MGKFQIGLQIYSVRNYAEKDFAGTLGKVKRMGYDFVELAGYGNLKTAVEARKAADDAGVKIVGAHVGWGAFEGDWNRLFDEQDVLGNKHVALPWIGKELQSVEGYGRVGKVLAGAGLAGKGRGFTVAYHNHSFEFAKFEGRYGLDVLFEGTDAGVVRSELDVFWVKHGGVEPAGYLEKLGRRVSYLHLKDAEKGDGSRFAPVGKGSLDMGGIVAAARRVGVEFGIVEEDSSYERDSLEDAKVSLEYLKSIGVD